MKKVYGIAIKAFLFSGIFFSVVIKPAAEDRVCVVGAGVSADSAALSREKREHLGDALVEAAWRGDAQEVEQLIAQGAPVNARHTSWRDTALHAAVRQGHETIVPLLIARGADVNAQGSMAETPLVASIEGPNSGGIRAFETWPEQEMSAHIASRLASLQLLLASPVQLDRKGIDPEETTALLMAVNELGL